MEFVIGTVLGAAVALIAGRLAPARADEAEESSRPKPNEEEQSMARQWENLLSYTGEKQHEE